jgi:hypothetical protein
MSNVDEFSPRFLPQQVRTWSVFVDSMQQMYDQNSAVAVRAAGACANEDPVQESCWSDVIGQYGRGLLRRPLFDDERELLVSQVRGKNLRGGLPLIVGQLLRSPEFMFHVELGGDAEGDHVRLTGYEVANRIAFATIGTGPDAALKDAIDRDELRTLEQVAAHVRRLLADPRAQDKLKRFFAEWFGFSRMKAPDYAYVNDRLDLRFGGELKSLMTHELVEFAHHVIWKEKGTFHDLMTRQIAFPRNETMRKVFDTGAIVPDGSSEPIEVQHHAGLGVRPGMMLNSGWETSPILRGAFVLNRLLCAEVPPPDFTQVAARFDALPGLDPVKLANYEVTNQLTHVEPCWTCHQKINPMGFIYEGFDPIGMRRTEQKVWKSFYELATTHPIPLPIENLVIEAGLPTTFANPIEFAAALAESDKLRFCMSTYLFRHMQKRKESQADSCAIEEMVAVLREGRPVLDMFIKSIANEDVFWRRSQ